MNKVFFILLLLLGFFCGCGTYCSSEQERIFESKIEGRIIKKSFLKLNKNECFIKIEKNDNSIRKIILFKEKSGFTNDVQVGDSLSKPENSLKIIVFKDTGEKKYYELNFPACR